MEKGNMVKSAFYTDRGGKWASIGSILWSGKQGEEPWNKDNGISSHVKMGYGRVDYYPSRQITKRWGKR